MYNLHNKFQEVVSLVGYNTKYTTVAKSAKTWNLITL